MRCKHTSRNTESQLAALDGNHMHTQARCYSLTHLAMTGFFVSTLGRATSCALAPTAAAVTGSAAGAALAGAALAAGAGAEAAAGFVLADELFAAVAGGAVCAGGCCCCCGRLLSKKPVDINACD